MVGLQNDNVLVFWLLFCQSVQALETGYVYFRKELVGIDSLCNDLKCAYLFSGVTHMRLIKLLIDQPYDPQKKIVTGNYYRSSVRLQIASLYRLKVRRMGSLWLLHLYLNLVHGLVEHSKDMQQDYVKLLATQDYIIEKLYKDLTGCRQGNSYDSFDSMINSKHHPTQDELNEMVHMNERAAKGLLKRNRICTNSFGRHFVETIKMRRIFMNNFGSRTVYVNDLMNVFNVQVMWSDVTKVRLEKSYLDVRTLDWTTDNLQNIKSYYSLTYSFLKILMFRLTLKHITYLQHYSVGSHDYVHYAQEWYKVVKKFGIMFNLTNELHVKSLLAAIHNLSTGIEKIDSVVSYVIAILHSLCLPLGCKAVEPFILDSKEFRIPYESAINGDLISFKNTTSRVPIEYNSLENTRIFFLYLDRVFEFVNFRLIQLLTEYIDEIQMENEMERFNNFHPGSSDFDYL